MSGSVLVLEKIQWVSYLKTVRQKWVYIYFKIPNKSFSVTLLLFPSNVADTLTIPSHQSNFLLENIV